MPVQRLPSEGLEAPSNPGAAPVRTTREAGAGGSGGSIARGFRLVPPVLAAVGLAGCALKTELRGTEVAPGYTGAPRRVFVVDAIDPRYGSGISAGFRAAMRDGLARCGMATADFKPDAMELNNNRRGAAEIAAFDPDLLVRIRMERTFLFPTGGSSVENTYEVSARERGGRVVWRTQVSTHDIIVYARNGTDADRPGRGGDIAAKVIERMAADRVLPPACANPPPSPGAPPRRAS